jgi:hypothetical protein
MEGTNPRIFLAFSNSKLNSLQTYQKGKAVTLHAKEAFGERGV